MADGALAIATVTMAGAIRRVSIEHGLDPRDFVLFCYGGGGPLHASALAHELSIPQVIIPPEPGNFSAIGMLLADARIDFAKTFTGLLDDKIVGTMEEEFGAMEREAADALTREFGASEIFYERHAEMRYRGQRHNIKVPITGLKTVEAIHEAFSRDYKRRYGHADSKAPAEVQALLVSGFAKLAPAGYRAACRGAPAKAAARARGRSISARPAAWSRRMFMSATRCRRFRRRRPGGDRGIRLDDGGLAGRPLRDRRDGRNPHRLQRGK